MLIRLKIKILKILIQNNISLINIRSLYANLPLLTDYIIEYKPDILVLTETWLIENDSNYIYEFLTLHYNFKYITRPDSSFGGVCIIFKDTYKLNKFKNHTIAYSDCLISNIKINNNTDLNLILVIYRPHSNNYISFINNLYELLSLLPSNNTIIMGDFNIKIPVESWIDTIKINDTFLLAQECIMFLNNYFRVGKTKSVEGNT